MRLRLIILRHAEAVEISSTSEQADHSRPLTVEGRTAAQAVGKRLKDSGWEPTLVVSSDSKRTLETTRAMQFSKAPTEIVAPSFYLAGMAAIQRELTFSRVLPHKTIMVVGHNPGWSVAIESLAGQAVSLRTADAALLELEADNWNDALQLEDSWSLVKVVSARSEAYSDL